MSLNDLVVHFGLDSVDVVDAKIIFPSQKTITLTSLQKGKLYEVYEYSGLIGSTILTFNYYCYLSANAIRKTGN